MSDVLEMDVRTRNPHSDLPVDYFEWPCAFKGDIAFSSVRGHVDFRRLDFDLAIWFNEDFSGMARRKGLEKRGMLPDDEEVIVPSVRLALQDSSGVSWYRKILARPPVTEFDCANHLEKVLSRIVRYNFGIKSFMIYDSQRGIWIDEDDGLSWNQTVGSALDRIIGEFTRALIRAGAVLDEMLSIVAPDPGPKPNANANAAIQQAWNAATQIRKELKEDTDRVEKMALSILNGKYRAIKDLLADRMRYDQTAWDSDTRWIVVKDGVINVEEVSKTKEVRLYGFAPEYMSTMALDVALQDAHEREEESEWEKGVKKVLPELGVRQYLQKRFGAALLGKPGLAGKSMVWQWGMGDTAKSTIQECVAGSKGVFEPYSITSSAKALTKNGEKLGATDRFKAYARGKRFAIMSEMDDGDALAQGELKVMTGGESVEGTAKYANAVNYYFTATIFMASNHQPTFPPGDTAARTRIHVVPFTHKLFIRSKDPEGWNNAPPEHRADEGWADKVLNSPLERAAILRWVLDGLVLFGQEGIGELPQEMIDSAEEFAADADPVGQMVNVLLGNEVGYDGVGQIKIYTDEEWERNGYSNSDGLLLKEFQTLLEIQAHNMKLLKPGEVLPRRWASGAKGMLSDMGGAKKKIKVGNSTAWGFSRVKLVFSPHGMDKQFQH